MSVCIISTMCLQHRLLFLTNSPVHSYYFLIPYNPSYGRNMRWSPYVQSHPALVQSQQSTLINELWSLHVRGWRRWAQPDWIAASVSLISPEELWGQVLFNGTEDASHLRWRGSSSTWSMNHSQQVWHHHAANLHTYMQHTEGCCMVVL